MATAKKLDELQQKIIDLEKERDLLFRKEKALAIDQVNEIIRRFHIRSRELTFSGTGAGRGNSPGNRAKVPVKYKLSHNVWTGRGRKPRWVEEFLANGGKMKELQVRD